MTQPRVRRLWNAACVATIVVAFVWFSPIAGCTRAYVVDQAQYAQAMQLASTGGRADRIALAANPLNIDAAQPC